MKCKACGSSDSKVLESRVDAGAIKRRRECLSCNFRWTTYETAQMPSFIVLKKNGKREPFEREKIEQGLLRACQKRNVSIEQISQIVDNVEAKIAAAGSKEVKSTLLGEFILQKLKEIDDVAYIRFASVYKEFDTKHDFLEVITGVK